MHLLMFVVQKTVRVKSLRHYGILNLNTVPEHSGTGLDPLIPVPDWFWHQHFSSFRYRTDWLQDSPTFRHLKKGFALHVHTAGGGNGYTLDVHTAGVSGCVRDSQCTSKLQADLIC
jgi:hypothetical protein